MRFTCSMGHCTCLALLGFWLVSSGIGCSLAPIWSGQHELSPDERYNASARYYYDCNREWLVLLVQRASTETTIWEKDLGDRVAVHPPFDQGMGYLDLIQWSDDSTEVRFAHRVSNVTTVEEWLIVKLDSKDAVLSTELLPGTSFPWVDLDRVTGDLPDALLTPEAVKPRANDSQNATPLPPPSKYSQPPPD